MVRDPHEHAAPESEETRLFGNDPQNSVLLQTVLDSLTYPLYVIDVASHRVRLANRTAQETCQNGAATCYALTHRRDKPCDTEDHPCPIETIRRTGQPTVVEHVHYDAAGAARNVEVHAFPIFDAAHQLVQIIEYCVDITERKRVEQALRASEERLRASFDNAGVGLAEATTEYRFISVNDCLCQILGYSRAELIGKTVHELTAPEDRATSDAWNARLHDGRSKRIDYEKRYLRRDGSRLWVHVTVSVIHAADGRPRRFIATIEDINERKEAEAAFRDLNAMLETKVAQRTAELEHRARQLQRLTLELSEAEDQERRRLAEILHDDLQQLLAAAKFHLGLLKSQVKQDPSQQALAGQIEQMLKEAIEKSRSLSHELSPAVLHGGDFAGALRWLAEQVQAKHGLVVHVQAAGTIDVRSDALRSFLYKAALETLFNVVKHAGVKNAYVRVRRLGRYVGLSVLDRGRGFDPQDLKVTAGFGLLSIRERVELLGGRMKIHSAKGHGSAFYIIVPDPPIEKQPGEVV